MTNTGQSRERSRLCPVFSSIFKKAKRFEFCRSVSAKTKVERLLSLPQRDGDPDHSPELTVHLQFHFPDGDPPLRVIRNGNHAEKLPRSSKAGRLAETKSKYFQPTSAPSRIPVKKAQVLPLCHTNLALHFRVVVIGHAGATGSVSRSEQQRQPPPGMTSTAGRTLVPVNSPPAGCR